MSESKTTRRLYDDTFAAARLCLDKGHHVAAAMICFALHEGLAATCHPRRIGPKERFVGFARKHLNWSDDQSTRMWKARNGILHSFGLEGNVIMLEPKEQRHQKHLDIESKGRHIFLRVESYMKELKGMFRRLKSGPLETSGQFRAH